MNPSTRLTGLVADLAAEFAPNPALDHVECESIRCTHVQSTFVSREIDPRSEVTTDAARSEARLERLADLLGVDDDGAVVI